MLPDLDRILGLAKAYPCATAMQSDHCAVRRTGVLPMFTREGVKTKGSKRDQDPFPSKCRSCSLIPGGNKSGSARRT
jgi:hypothetical protein